MRAPRIFNIIDLIEAAILGFLIAVIITFVLSKFI